MMNDGTNPGGMAQATAGTLDLTRALFIQKVYSLFTLSMLAAAVGAFMSAGMSLAVGQAAAIAGFVCLIVAFFTRKSYPLNLVVLFGFTFLEGMAAGPILGLLTGAGHGDIVAQALLLTTVTFGSLTAYVFWSKKDFSFLGGFLFTALLGMLAFSLFGWLFGGVSSGMHLVYCYFGVLVFVGYILYDTSNIIRNYPPDEYIAATIALFLDFLNLFWFILQILLSRDD